jgi:hypothetical protein
MWRPDIEMIPGLALQAIEQPAIRVFERFDGDLGSSELRAQRCTFAFSVSAGGGYTVREEIDRRGPGTSSKQGERSNWTKR